jgi:hypothetical protein
MAINDNTPAAWDPTAGRVYTFFNENGRSYWGGETLEELKATGKVSAETVALPFVQALELQDQADRARYCTGPQLITQERYEEMLNVLPPENWQRGVGYSCFRLSERLCGAIASFFVRIGDSYYQINENENTDPGALFRACMDHDAPPESAAAICRRAGC